MSSEKLENLSLEEARKTLLDVWTKCEFGVKERVKRIISTRTIHYILSTPTYSKKSKIIECIKTIKEAADEVKCEVENMVSGIEETIK